MSVSQKIVKRTFSLHSTFFFSPFLFRAQLLLPIAETLKPRWDNCGEKKKKIYILVVKQPWSQDEVCMCASQRPSSDLAEPKKLKKKKKSKQNKQHLDWSMFVLCEFSTLLAGSARCHGCRRATWTGGIHSKFLSLQMYTCALNVQHMIWVHYICCTNISSSHHV